MNNRGRLQQGGQDQQSISQCVKGFFSSLWSSISGAVWGTANQQQDSKPSPSVTQTVFQSVQQLIVPKEPVLCPKYCYIRGLSTTLNYTVGNSIDFSLYLADDHGKEFGNEENQVIHPSSIQILVTGVMDLVPQATSPQESSSLPSTNNVRQVSFSPTISGQYKVHVKVLNEHVHGSPFKINVAPGSIDASKCELTGELNSVRDTVLCASRPILLQVELHDQYGNAVNATRSNLNQISVLFDMNMSLNNPNFTTVHDIQDGKIQLTIVPNQSGTYLMQIFFDTEKLVNRHLDVNGWMEIVVLDVRYYEKLKRVLTKQEKKSFKVTSTNLNDPRDVKEGKMVIADVSVRFEIPRLFFFSKVVYSFPIAEVDIGIDYNNTTDFTISYASFKDKIKTVRNDQGGNSPKYLVSCKKRFFAVALLKLLRIAKPLNEIDMKQILSGLFGDFQNYSELEKIDIYNLFRHDSTANQLFQQYLQIYLTTEGDQIFQNFTLNAPSSDSLSIAQNSAEEQTIDDILHYAQMMRSMIDKNFFGQKELHGLLKTTISNMMSSDAEENQSRPSVMLRALSFSDQLLKSGSLDERKLDKIISVFKLVQDKDILQTLYHRQLAHRLISGCDDTSLYDERVMLAKLKTNFGLHFTFRMEGMVRDVSNNQNIVEAFISHQNKHHDERKSPEKPNSSINGIVFKPLILTHGYWPALQPNLNQLWPRELDECIQTFNGFYTLHSSKGRKLSWVHSAGNATIVARFWSGQYELTLPTLHTCVLLLFNQLSKDESLSIRQVATNLNISSHKHIADIFKKLASTKCKLVKVKASNDGGATNVDSEFVVNEDFKSNLTKIKIADSTHVTSQSAQEKKEVKETVDQERKYSIEAALIRVIKARKAMSYKALVDECAKQLLVYFKPEVRMIKQRIETLIEREFIARDEKDSTIINYLA